MFQISAACELAFCHSVVSLAEPETVSKFIAAAFVVRLDVRSLHDAVTFSVEYFLRKSLNGTEFAFAGLF